MIRHTKDKSLIALPPRKVLHCFYRTMVYLGKSKGQDKSNCTVSFVVLFLTVFILAEVLFSLAGDAWTTLSVTSFLVNLHS